MSQTSPAAHAVESPFAPPLRAYLVLAFGIVSVSLAAIFIRLALTEGVPALTVAASRLVLATLVLTPLTLRRYPHEVRGVIAKPRQLGLLLIAGVFLAIHFAAWVSSLQYGSVLVTGVLVTTSPIWVGLLEVFVLKTRLSQAIIIGLVIALIGGVIIAFPTTSDAANAAPAAETTSDSNGAIIGGALALTGALTFSVYMIIGRKSRATLSLLPYIWIVYGTAALILVVVMLFNGQSFFGYNSTAYLWMLLLGIFPQLLGHSSFNYAVAYLPATYISIATQVEAPLSAIAAFFVFNEVPGWTQILGSAVVIVGVTIATLRRNG